MNPLNQQQRAKIATYLDEQGLTLLPLRNEMMDHLICDIESHLARGCTFDEAWQRTTEEIPSGHFKNLQTETMEATNKRFNLSRSFALVSLSLLLAASVFKLLHLQYSNMLLFASFGTMMTALVAGAVSGARLHKQKEGRLMLTGVVLGVILFLTAWCMQVLHLPGSFLLRIISAPLLLILLSSLIIYFRTRNNSDSNILIYLHNKHTAGISRFLVILLAIGVGLKLLALALGYEVGIPHVVLAFVTGGAGLQLFALHWHHEAEGATGARDYGILVALTVGFIAFMIPTLAYNVSGIPLTVKVVAVTIFFLMTGAVIVSESNRRAIPLAVVAVSWVYILAWAAASLEWVDTAMREAIFNLPVLVMLAGALVASRQHRTLMTYMMMVVANFLLFY